MLLSNNINDSAMIWRCDRTQIKQIHQVFWSKLQMKYTFVTIQCQIAYNPNT